MPGRRQFRAKWGLLVLCLFLSCIKVSEAITIYVPADQPTIQAGIDAAVAGDTVLVADGAYTGDGNYEINFGGKGIHLKSENGTDFTTIDGSGSVGASFRFVSGEDSTAVVEGFTIYFGPIFINGASPMIIGNHFRRGGIDCELSSAIISGNILDSCYGSVGGAIYCDNRDTSQVYHMRILDNLITNNHATYYGGGIYIFAYCFTDRSEFTLSGNTITGNTTTRRGGGIYEGGRPKVTLTNNIIWGNKAGQGGNEIWEDIGGPRLKVSYCCIRGGWFGEGNITSDPMFVDPENEDYNLCLQSPCIDAGDPSVSDPDSSRSDIGVYYPEHSECTVGIVRYVSTDGDDKTGDGAPENPFRTIQRAVDVSRQGDSVRVGRGMYGAVLMSGKGVSLSSEYIFSSDTLDLLNTVIQPFSPADYAVEFDYCDSFAALTGFTIMSSYKTGIGCIYSDPTISNNNIIENGNGGIKCSYSNVNIINCLISNNKTSQAGGGIYSSNSSINLSGCVFKDNVAYGFGGFSPGGGAAIYSSSDSLLSLTNCTFVGNSQSVIRVVTANNDIPAVISNCIFAWNAPESDGTTLYFFPDSANVVLSCCNIYGNGGGDWVDQIAGQANINGNFSADPLFCDTAVGDFGLSVFSPCLPQNNSCGALIGALDLGDACCCTLAGDADGGGDVNVADAVFAIKYVFVPESPAPPCCGQVDADGGGDVNVGDAIWIIRFVFLGGEAPSCPSSGSLVCP